MRTAALRAAARVASRSARRNIRRSLLVVAMVALPVALMTASATIARTIVGSPEDDVVATMGSADLAVDVGRGFNTDRLSKRLPPGSQALTLHTADIALVRQGEFLNSTLVEPDEGLDSPVLAGLYELSSGHAPTRPEEAAVNERLLEVSRAEIGDEIEVGAHRLTVTGTVLARELDDPLAIVGSGTLVGGEWYGRVLIDLPEGVPMDSAAQRLGNHGGYITRDEVAAFAARDATTWDLLSLVGGVLALFGTGLIAAAAFVVGARRQLRELGLVGAMGGEPRHVRAIVWLGGTTLGLLGGVLGSISGVAIAFAVHPLLDRFIGRLVGPVEVNPLVVGAAILVSTLAATIAALAPARAAGKLSVMAALAGRTAPPRPPGRVAAIGLVALTMGAMLTAWATLRDAGGMLAAGLVAMLVGILFAIPLLVAVIGRVTNGLPTTVRLAARDAARHGRRTGAAVAAAVIMLAVPVAVSAYMLGEETFERRSPRLFDNQLLIGMSGDEATSAHEVAAAFKDALPDASVVPLIRAVRSRSAEIQEGSVYVGVVAPGELGGGTTAAETITGWPLFVGDAKTLDAMGAEGGSQALKDGGAVVLGGYVPKNGFIRVRLPKSGQTRRKVPAIAVDSPAYFNETIPKILISPKTASHLGLEQQVSHHLFSAHRPVTRDDVVQARKIAERHPGVFVNSNEDYLPKYALGRAASTAATVPLALAILAVAVALVASESRRSHQILVAVGAGPIAHRKIVAATSGLLALITAVLAVPAGMLPTVVVQIASQAGRPVVVPWTTIAIVVLVTPVLSAVVAGLVSRTPKLGSLLSPAT